MFHNQKYLNRQEVIKMASMLKMSETQVRIWFQNRRRKWSAENALCYDWLFNSCKIIFNRRKSIFLLFQEKWQYLIQRHRHHRCWSNIFAKLLTKNDNCVAYCSYQIGNFVYKKFPNCWWNFELNLLYTDINICNFHSMLNCHKYHSRSFLANLLT
jgi:hypothetical protein